MRRFQLSGSIQHSTLSLLTRSSLSRRTSLKHKHAKNQLVRANKNKLKQEIITRQNTTKPATNFKLWWKEEKRCIKNRTCKSENKKKTEREKGDDYDRIISLSFPHSDVLRVLQRESRDGQFLNEVRTWKFRTFMNINELPQRQNLSPSSQSILQSKVPGWKKKHLSQYDTGEKDPSWTVNYTFSLSSNRRFTHVDK